MHEPKVYFTASLQQVPLLGCLIAFRLLNSSCNDTEANKLSFASTIPFLIVRLHKTLVINTRKGRRCSCANRDRYDVKH